MTVVGPSPNAPPARARLHVLVLLLLCAVAYFPGLDRHGVTNWQEAQRLVVAREMQDRFHAHRAEPHNDDGPAWRELLLPTSNTRPYLAKPPMIYWAQIGVAEALGDRVELWHLRLVVALAATIGVIACYFSARIILSPDSPAAGLGGVQLGPELVGRAAFWAAACLATGILYVRSGRIGELDILLVPSCTIAIGAVAHAWRTHRARRGTSIGSVAIAVIATSLAALTKDPGVMIVGLAAFGGIGLWAALAPAGTPVDVALVRGRGRAPLESLPSTSLGLHRFAVAIAASFGLATVIATLRGGEVDSLGDLLGLLVLVAMAAFVGFVLGRMFVPLRFRAMLVALSRTHPLLVIGVALMVRLAWGWTVAGIIGTGQAENLVRQEVEDNIRLFVAEAPINNLEAVSFGVGLGSIAAIVSLIWLIRDRTRPPASWFQLFAWLAFTLIAFSILGKGVQRYLTPMWPAVAMLGGVSIASAVALSQSSCRACRWVRPALTLGVIALALGQGWWYGFGRERNAERSPRDLIAELRARQHVTTRRIVSIEFSTPALDYYLDRHVLCVGDPRVSESMAGGGWWTFDRLKQWLERKGPVFALMRTGATPGEPPGTPTAIERFRAMGVEVSEVATHSGFRIDKDRSDVRCYRLRIGRGAATDPSDDPDPEGPDAGETPPPPLTNDQSVFPAH